MWHTQLSIGHKKIKQRKKTNKQPTKRAAENRRNNRRKFQSYIQRAIFMLFYVYVRTSHTKYKRRLSYGNNAMELWTESSSSSSSAYGIENIFSRVCKHIGWIREFILYVYGYAVCIFPLFDGMCFAVGSVLVHSICNVLVWKPIWTCAVVVTTTLLSADFESIKYFT